MSIIKRIWRKNIYDDIKKKRDKYIVTYRPINLKSDKFAKLHITFTEPVGDKEIANIMEEEFGIWISKLPLPLMVTAFDNKGEKISLKNVREDDDLIGYVEDKGKKVVKLWGVISDDRISEQQLTDENIKDVYEGLSYERRIKKEKKRDKKLEQKKKIIRFFDIFLILWFIASVTIAFLGWQHFLIGAIAFIYSVYQTVKRFLKLKGYKTEKEKEKQEKMRMMKHYYYHCERNPEVFRKLVAENFEEEEKARIQKERENIES